MNELFKKIKQYYYNKLDYYKTRSKLKNGHVLHSYFKIPELRCTCEKCVIKYQAYCLETVIDIVYDNKDKYNLELSYEYAIGTQGDDFIKNLMTIKIEMKHDNFAGERTLEMLKYYE